MIPAATPLVKYDNPVLISKNTDKKAKVNLYNTAVNKRYSMG